ncbi:hypothetical protein PPSIR1_05338 [Plesiocystis pacifica SIR-1]|uniref:Uncharacterized protein n=1 Tax=Plesiocystis pacifica SIR-1 TaxID=391625 RepID=A6FX40_9BACT|nr:hypothetical protein PPSIR1_05338 [Plesiocystis pacifica SIR-1]
MVMLHFDRSALSRREASPRALRPLVLVSAFGLFAGCYAEADENDTGTETFGADDVGDDMGTESVGGGEAIEIDPANMIDDLEDCDDAIIEQGGRGGSWYSYNDASGGTQTPSGTQTPASGGVTDSDMCQAMTSGGGFSEWGAGIGFDFVNDGVAAKMPYDASEFTGVAFWAKGSVTDLRVNLLIPDVLPEAEGGTCVPSSPDAGDCSDAHGVAIALTEEWQQFQIDFDMVTQQGWGQAAAFDPARLMSMHWYIPQDQDFELALDDIGLY